MPKIDSKAGSDASTIQAPFDIVDNTVIGEYILKPSTYIFTFWLQSDRSNSDKICALAFKHLFLFITNAFHGIIQVTSWMNQAA